MKGVAVVLSLAMLVGCQSAPKYNFNYEERNVVLKLVDSFEDPNQYGNSYCTKESCVLVIRKDKYPHCFLHEIRHAFEGKFHGDSPSGAYCR